MLPIRRKAVQTAGRLPTASVRATRQYSATQPQSSATKDLHGPHPGDHGEHHHAEPVAESLGTGFFVVLAAIPITLGLYAISRPGKEGEPNGFSKMITSYSAFQEKNEARNTLHTAAIESAAFDRQLFHNSTQTTHMELKFPEIFNTGSPHNVVAGQGSRDMDSLVAHYRKQNADEVERQSRIAKERSG